MCGGKAVKRVYEKSVKGYVYAISGGPGHKMQLPKDERKGRESNRTPKSPASHIPSSASKAREDFLTPFEPSLG
jgi:hypothetical protein